MDVGMQLCWQFSHAYAFLSMFMHTHIVALTYAFAHTHAHVCAHDYMHTITLGHTLK